MFVTMIKKSLVMALGLVAVLSLRAEANPSSPCVAYSAPVEVSSYPLSGTTLGSGVLSTDPVGPFPLSALVPFPWRSIDGIWSMKRPDGTKLHLSFEVRVACDGRKLLHILEFDQKTYRVTSEGVGLALTDSVIAGKDTTVRAVMSSHAYQYTIFVRQFRIPPPPGKTTVRVSTLVTVRPFAGDESNEFHMVARRSSALTLAEYIENQKEIEAKRDAGLRKKILPPRR